MPPTVAITASARTSPCAKEVTAPSTPGGTSTRYSSGPGTTPSTAPDVTTSPTRTRGSKGQPRSVSPLVEPGVRNVGAVDSERNNPSNTWPSNPGPKWTDSGRPLGTATAPGPSPAVDSYEELRRRVAAAVGRLAEDPALRGRLVAAVWARLGPDATVLDAAGGGVVGVAAGRRIDLSLAAVAERAVDALGGEVRALWAP